MRKIKLDVPVAGLTGNDYTKSKYSVAAVVFLIFCLCCGGAFGLEEMIPAAGPGMTVLMLCILPFIWALPIGLYTSEMTALAPVDAGPYVWTKMAFGELWGFIVNWWMIIAIYLGIAAYVVLAASYLGKLVDISDTGLFIFMVAIIVVTTVINLLGLKEVSIVSTILSIAVIVVFAAIAVAGFTHWDHSPVEPFLAVEGDAFSSFGVALCVGIWLYCGYPAISSVVGEIENPQVVPKAMKIAILVISLLYILPTIAGLASVGPWDAWGSDYSGGSTVNYATVLSNAIGPIGAFLVTLIAVVGTFICQNSTIASGSRMFTSLAEDNLCPAFLTKKNKRNMPVFAILIMAVIEIVMINFDFSIIVTMTSTVLFLIYVTLGFTFLKLRKKYPVEERGDVYYVKGGKVVCAYIIVALFCTGTLGMWVNGTEYFLLGFVAMISGPIFYVLFKLIYGGFHKFDAERYPINKKTRMAPGDVPRLGIIMIIFGLLAFFGSLFLQFYEGSWGEAYYLEVYGSGLMANFWLMVKIARFGGLIMAIVGVITTLIGVKKDPFVANEMIETEADI